MTKDIEKEVKHKGKEKKPKRTKQKSNKDQRDRKERAILIMKDYRSNDPIRKEQAIAHMLEETEGLIGHVAKKYFGAFVKDHYQDLYDEGVIGVIEGMGRFNPEKGAVSTFFTYEILHAMSEYVNSLTNKSSTYYATNMNKVKKALEHFDNLQISPSITDISLESELSVKKVQEALKRINATNEFHYETDAELDAQLTQTMPDPAQELVEKETKEALINALGKLEPIDREMLMLKFGFDDETPKSYSAIAKIVGLPINQVNASVANSLRTLRKSPELVGEVSPKKAKRTNKALDKTEIPITPSGIVDVYAQLGNGDGNVKIDIEINKQNENNEATENKGSKNTFIIKF